MSQMDEGKRAGQTIVQVEKLEKETSILHEKINILVNILSPVLLSETPEKEEIKEKETVILVPLANTIKNIRGDTVEARRKLVSIIDRIEL